MYRMARIGLFLDSNAQSRTIFDKVPRTHHTYSCEDRQSASHLYVSKQDMATGWKSHKSHNVGPSLHGCHGSRNRSQVPKVPKSLRAKSYRKPVPLDRSSWISLDIALGYHGTVYSPRFKDLSRGWWTSFPMKQIQAADILLPWCLVNRPVSCQTLANLDVFMSSDLLELLIKPLNRALQDELNCYPPVFTSLMHPCAVEVLSKLPYFQEQWFKHAGKPRLFQVWQYMSQTSSMLQCWGGW